MLITTHVTAKDGHLVVLKASFLGFANIVTKQELDFKSRRKYLLRLYDHAHLSSEKKPFKLGYIKFTVVERSKGGSFVDIANIESYVTPLETENKKTDKTEYKNVGAALIECVLRITKSDTYMLFTKGKISLGFHAKMGFRFVSSSDADYMYEDFPEIPKQQAELLAILPVHRKSVGVFVAKSFRDSSVQAFIDLYKKCHDAKSAGNIYQLTSIEKADMAINAYVLNLKENIKNRVCFAFPPGKELSSAAVDALSFEELVEIAPWAQNINEITEYYYLQPSNVRTLSGLHRHYRGDMELKGDFLQKRLSDLEIKPSDNQEEHRLLSLPPDKEIDFEIGFLKASGEEIKTLAEAGKQAVSANPPTYTPSYVAVMVSSGELEQSADQSQQQKRGPALKRPRSPQLVVDQ